MLFASVWAPARIAPLQPVMAKATPCARHLNGVTADAIALRNPAPS